MTAGEINRLLINVPPGCMKSMLTAVFWPAWEWGPRNLVAHRYITASYSEKLTVRDNQRFLRLLLSRTYRSLWGERFNLERLGDLKIQNDRTGWKLATSVGGLGTGERGDRFIIDDPHNVKKGESEADRAEKLSWFTEVVPTRMNDPATSAIVVIMQRVHQDDISGRALELEDQGYVHLMLPMEFDPQRKCVTAIGFEDPRSDEGELLWPARMTPEVVARDKAILGPYAVAAQFQQAPAPRGGGIIKRDWWQLWPPDGEDGERALWFPDMEFVLASVDTAMTTKEQNDWSALTVWGCWRDENDLPKLMLMTAWHARLEFHELVEKIIATCRKQRVNTLLVEAKANGISVAQEIIRLCADQDFGTVLNEVSGDKLARVYSIQHLFSAGLVFAPDRKWADLVISQCEVFPKAKHDDLVDTVSQALRFLRENGLAVLREERDIDLGRRLAEASTPSGRSRLPYDL